MKTREFLKFKLKHEGTLNNFYRNYKREYISISKSDGKEIFYYANPMDLVKNKGKKL